MKLCPQCKKEYDDSWSVCLKCGLKLYDAPGISGEEIRKSLLRGFEKIEKRLSRIEERLGLNANEDEKLVYRIERAERTEKPAAEPSSPQPDEKHGQKDLESTIGLVWLNRIGVLALLFGFGFFLKYAFDNKWIGELGRVAIGLIAGFALVAASEIVRKKNYTVFSQGLFGGGIGILYLSIYASSAFYNLIGAVPAVIFMAVITVFSGFWSCRTNWMSPAVIGILGGFITPLIFGLKGVNAPALFIYVFLLDAGVLYVSLYKKWAPLNLLSFFFTHFIIYDWLTSHYEAKLLIPSVVLITVFFFLFSVLSVIRNLLGRERSIKADVLLVFFNGIAYFLELYFMLKDNAGPLPGLLPLSLGFVYIIFSYSAMTRAKEDRDIILTYVSMAILFVTITIPVQLKYNWISVSWALEALVLVWLGFMIDYLPVRRMGLLIGLAGVLKLLLFDYNYSLLDFARHSFLVNGRMLSYCVVVAAVFAAGYLYKKYKEKTAESERWLAVFLVILANVLLIIQLSVEAKAYFANAAYARAVATGLNAQSPQFFTAFHDAFNKQLSACELSRSILWILYALACVAAGIYRKFRALRIMALALFAAAILKIVIFDMSGLDKIYRVTSFISLGIVLLAASFFYQKYKNVIMDFTLKD